MGLKFKIKREYKKILKKKQKNLPTTIFIYKLNNLGIIKFSENDEVISKKSSWKEFVVYNMIKKKFITEIPIFYKKEFLQDVLYKLKKVNKEL